MTIITSYKVSDVRFPTSKTGDGSDAKHKDPNYSAAYLTLYTDNDSLTGHGLTFTIGNGNQFVVAAITELMKRVIGKDLDDIKMNMANFWRDIVYGDTQLVWVGQDSGVKALATAAVINATWDLWAKSEKKPLYRLLSDFSAEELVSCIDFHEIENVLSKEEALNLLKDKADNKLERLKAVEKKGYPAYCTSAGWSGYSDKILVEKCKELDREKWPMIKIKVGTDLQADLRRIKLVKDAISPGTKLMVDANQVYNVKEAIEAVKAFAPYDLFFFEEPLNPMDIDGHKEVKAIANALGLKVASGEQCPNSVIYKQFIKQDAIDICQFDPCRLMGINEALAVMLMAVKYNKPVYPHAGGVGLCNIVQHLSWAYFILFGREDVTEYIDHLQEHFVHPVVMKDNKYLPTSYPGCGIEMKSESVKDYNFNTGKFWSLRKGDLVSELVDLSIFSKKGSKDTESSALGVEPIYFIN